jgi:hypothetical protein
MFSASLSTAELPVFVRLFILPVRIWLLEFPLSELSFVFRNNSGLYQQKISTPLNFSH